MTSGSGTAVTTAEPGRLATMRAFLRDVVAEMRKVTWPTWDEVRKATIAIVVFVGILGVAIGLLDSVLQFVLVKLVARMFG